MMPSQSSAELHAVEILSDTTSTKKAPATAVQDKIYFIMNNLEEQNVEAKAKELTEILNEQYYPWFAEYMVMKRASIEPNLHDLYLMFIDKVSLKPLIKEIHKATYDECKVLLGSHLIKFSVEARSLLKNLGRWLGKITIGQNHYLSAKEIDPKSLIISAYEKGLMVAVVPFTSKILEACSNSAAYQPHNPWVKAILALLVEIHALPNLKLNLKFEIEVLFKGLNVDLKDVHPSSLLVDRVREYEENPDFVTTHIRPLQTSTVNEPKHGIISRRDHVEQPLDVATTHAAGHPQIISQVSSGMSTNDTKFASLGFSDQLPSQGQLAGQSLLLDQLPVPVTNIEQQDFVNKDLQNCGLQTNFQSVLPIAMDRAIQAGGVSVLVHRIALIAFQTTKTLVLKDFAMEPEESVIRNAANLMVARLARSLAHVTCKEPLHVSLSSQLRTLLPGLSLSKDFEQAIQHFIDDNLDNGCILVEQAVAKKAVQMIAREIEHILFARRQYRENVGSQFFSITLHEQGPLGFWPEAFRPKAGQLSCSQLQVYEEFARSPEQRQSVSESLGVGSEEIDNNGYHVSSGYSTPPAIGCGRAGISENAATFPLTSSPELRLVQPSNPESENSEQPNNTISCSERFESNAFEALLATGDVLDHCQTASEKVALLFTEWYHMCKLPGTSDAACTRFVLRLHQRGLLRGDEISDRFFYRIMELSVANWYYFEFINSSSSQSHQGTRLSFLAIDICAKLIFAVLKFLPVDQGSNNLYILLRVLDVTVKFILKDAEERRVLFNPRPYFRFFENLLLDLGSGDLALDGVNFQVLTALAKSFHALQPLKVPEFSLVWLELVSHRSFMPKLLIANSQEGWPYIKSLLVDLFKFMQPFLWKAELAGRVQLLYYKTLWVLLVLSHHFPDFLCAYHFSFCDVIPPSCIQMRNIILCAYPRNMQLPPFSTPNLRIGLLPESRQPPPILSEVDAALKTEKIKSDLDEYLKTQQRGSSFFTELKQKLLLSPTDAVHSETRYNVPLINSLVLYTGMQAIQQMQERPPPIAASMSVFLEIPALRIFWTLIIDLDKEGRYHFLNAIANQLRYPNTHLHYFSIILLHLFASSNQDVIQDQIVRVLFERVIVKPHPWGITATFIELIKNPRYNFWNLSLTRCDPLIEHYLSETARHYGCVVPVREDVHSRPV